MPTVNVGEILECDQNAEIRTRGCDPCVALIIIYTNGGITRKKCAHFSVNIAGPLTQAAINAALDPILMGEFPLPLPANAIVGFTWGGNNHGMGGNEIFTRLGTYFPAANIVVQSNQDDSLTTAGLTINAMNLQVWGWTNVPPANLRAELQ